MARKGGNMGFSKKANGNRRETMPEDVKVDELNFMHVKNLKKKDFPITIVGFFINKGKFGLGVTLIGKDKSDEYIGLNIPSWYVDRFKEAEDDDIKQMFDGKLLLTGVEETTTKNGTTYQLEFEDVE